jgi:hypothetical protein
MYRRIKDFTRIWERKPGFIRFTHAEFVKIHPYIDGNGRTARLIMNYRLMSGGYLPVSIPKEDRLNYFETLEAYALDGDLGPFTGLIADLEGKRLDVFFARLNFFNWFISI